MNSNTALAVSTPVKLSCGHDSTPNGCATGYAEIVATGEKVCYRCAAEATRATMKRYGQNVLYLSSGAKPDGDVAVTTWDGTVISDRVEVLNRWRDNFGGNRIAFRFLFNGEVWTGSGPGYGQYCRVKRTKKLSLRA